MVERCGKGTYAGAERHECEPFLFVIKSVLYCQGVHGCFGDLVGWGREVVELAGFRNGGQGG